MSLTLTEARVRATLLAVQSYTVHLDLNDARSFGSRTRIRFTATEPGASTFVELADAYSVTATLNGSPVEAYAEGRLPLTGLAAQNTLVVDARLPYVTNGDGMHTFTDPADGERYVGAYCGMDIASRVFACFDQPDLKATIRLSVDAPSGWTVVANGRLVRRYGGHVGFARTPRIPPSLFAVCAGPFASVVFEHAGLPMGWHAPASLAAELERDAAELRRVTADCFDHYTRVFDAPYAFDSYDQLFVPGLNWGAMEQPGCVLYRDEYLTRGTPSAGERLWRSSTIAHEMAHMWFGDLVTMRWWEDSWLNESFADYMGYQVAGEAAGFGGQWVACALGRKPAAYRADARRSAHPVAEDTEAMTDVDTAFGNFDMITYAKGAAVLRQLVTWLGEEDFLAGVNAYLSRHAFGNAELTDLLAALAGVTDRDVRGWAQVWLRTTGFDTIRVERDGAVPVLHRDGVRPHRFHVAAYDDTGGLVDERLVDLVDEPLRLEEYAGLAVVPNSQDETYARIAFDETSWAFVCDHLGSVADPLTRATLWAATFDRVEQGRLPVADLLALASTHLAEETDATIGEAVLDRLADEVLRRFVGPADLAAAERVVAAAGRRLMRTGGDELAVAAARVVAGTSDDVDELADWLAEGRTRSGHEVDQDLRWDVVRRLAELDAGGDALVDAELARDSTATGTRGALTARAARPDPQAKAAAWDRMFADDTSNRDFSALAAGLWARGQGELLAPYLARFVAQTPDLARRRGQAFSQVIGWGFPWLPLPTEEVREFRRVLAEALLGDVPTVLARSLADRLDDLDVALRVRGIG